MKLTTTETEALRFLSNRRDECCSTDCMVSHIEGVNRLAMRRALKSLTRRDLIELGPMFDLDDGKLMGSGYSCKTKGFTEALSLGLIDG